MVFRIFVEKKPGLDNEARELKNDAVRFLGIQSLEKVRLLNRYDAENISEDLFSLAVRQVFSEPQLDLASESRQNGLESGGGDVPLPRLGHLAEAVLGVRSGP